MTLRCRNDHPHFKDRECNAKASVECTVPGIVTVTVTCHRCQGPILFVFDNEVMQ